MWCDREVLVVVSHYSNYPGHQKNYCEICEFSPAVLIAILKNLLQCDAVSFGKYLPTLRKSLQSQSSARRSPRKYNYK